MMTELGAPYGLLAEVTHRCPLHCAYCSNPLSLRAEPDELGTDEWLRVLDEAAGLGVVQVHLTGGEPLARADLEVMVARAHQLGLHTNLITSGMGITAARGQRLVAAGLNSVQLSVQGADPATTALVAASTTFEKKQQAAKLIRAAGLPLNMNVVLHRLNLDQLAAIIDLAVAWGAECLELTNTQYVGWALRNRAQLLPSKAQVMAARQVYLQRRDELAGRMELSWILPDCRESFPQRCAGGWATSALTVSPDGMVYPCPVASEITTVSFDSVREHELGWIWRDSPGFNAYRGTSWMPSPCRGCSRKELDFGGCRCQAFALTGDAGRTDPACIYAPDHELVRAAREQAEHAAPDPELLPAQLRYRRPSPCSVR